jgi:ribonuclease Y
LIVERAEKQSLTIIQQIEKKQESIEKKQEIINEKEKLLNLKEEQIDKDLFKISQLTEQEAKKIIFENYEKEYSKDLVNVVEKVKKETLETAKKQANDIIAKTVYRVAIEKSNNVLVDTVELPSEDYK